MKISKKLLFLGLLLLLQLPAGCGCGFNCSGGNDNDDGNAILTLGFSDSLPEDLKEVVIKVNAITFRRSGAEDVLIDEFTLTIDGEEYIDTEDFRVNLLEYQGTNQLVVITDLELEPGLYSEVSISIAGGSLENSYVKEADDTLAELNVAAGVLNLQDLRLTSGSQKYTVEFALAQALEYQSSSDSYLMTTEGIRMENNQTAATLSGQIDRSLFNSVSPCNDKTDPEQGNRVYIYKESDLLIDTFLADVFTSQSTEIPPDGVAPFAVASIAEFDLTGTWNYAFGFLPAGNYTLAFSCNTEADDSVQWNDLAIPLPTSQMYQIELLEGVDSQCNLSTDASC